MEDVRVLTLLDVPLEDVGSRGGRQPSLYGQKRWCYDSLAIDPPLLPVPPPAIPFILQFHALVGGCGGGGLGVDVFLLLLLVVGDGGGGGGDVTQQFARLSRRGNSRLVEGGGFCHNLTLFSQPLRFLVVVAVEVVIGVR